MVCHGQYASQLTFKRAIFIQTVFSESSEISLVLVTGIMAKTARNFCQVEIHMDFNAFCCYTQIQ